LSIQCWLIPPNEENDFVKIGLQMKTFLQLFILISSISILKCFAQTGWEVIPSGTNSKLNSIYFYDYEVGFAVGDSGTVIKSIDSGKTWQSLQTPVISNLNDIYLFHRDTVEIVGDSGTMLFSTDGGSSWWEGPSFLTDNYYCVTFSDGNGICGGSSQSILWGTYTGTALYWTEVQSGFFGGGFWGTSMLSPEIGFVAGENSIFQPLFGKTTDSGVTWEFTAFYLNNNEGQATGIDFTDVNPGYISARVWNGTGAISKTTDGGSNWVTSMFNNPLWYIHFPVSNASQTGYAVGDQGTILTTYDAGNNWIGLTSGTNLNLNDVFFLDSDFGFAVGENGIILRTISGGEPVTDIANKNVELYSFQLFQNYPNPFNPTTTIKFAIREINFVTIKVYDVLGNEIEVLVNEEKNAGEYEVELNAAGLTSGVYFYQLKAGSYIQVKKMVLLQ